MTSDTRPLAIVTGASAGIGYELAKCCAEQGFDLLIAADQPAIHRHARGGLHLFYPHPQNGVLCPRIVSTDLNVWLMSSYCPACDILAA
jgi:NAD(P)-dependent dehydrogenase (short-subunit alcohol dehydrogenase family)